MITSKKKIFFYILGSFVLGFILLIVISFFLYKCIAYADSDLFEHKTIVDISYYDQMWDNPEKYEGDNESILFPKSVESLDVTDYLFVYNVHLLKTEWQVALVVKYDEDNFEKELERIKTVCKNSPVYGETEYFDKPTYASIWDYGTSYEYAIVDEKNSEIAYIYFQHVYTDTYEFKIKEEYIPVKYRDMIDSDEINHKFSAYEKLTGVEDELLRTVVCYKRK